MEYGRGQFPGDRPFGQNLDLDAYGSSGYWVKAWGPIRTIPRGGILPRSNRTRSTPRLLKKKSSFAAALLAAFLFLGHPVGGSEAWAQMRMAEAPSLDSPAPFPLVAARLSFSSLRLPSDAWAESPLRMLAAFGSPPPLLVLPAPTLPNFKPNIPVLVVPVVPPRPVVPVNPPRGTDVPGTSQGGNRNPSLPGRGGVQPGARGPREPRIDIDEVQIPTAIQGERVDLGGGAFYFTYEALQGENPLFTQVKANWEKLNAGWSVRAILLRRGLKGRWGELQARQAQLTARARSFDESWPGLHIEERAEAFRQGWRTLTVLLAVWDTDADSYRRACERTEPKSTCVREHRRLVEQLDRLRDQQNALIDAWGQALKDANAFYGTVKSYSDEVEVWQGELLEFNRKLKSEAAPSEQAKCTLDVSTSFPAVPNSCCYFCTLSDARFRTCGALDQYGIQMDGTLVCRPNLD